jgi:SAM-dependent methyltransferase
VTTTQPSAVDPDALTKYSFTVWSYKQGEMVSLMIHLGDRLGLYRAMADHGPMHSEPLAAATGLHERFVREWLLGQAAAKLLTRHDDGSFELTPEGKAVLVDEEASLAFSAGAFRGGIEPEVLDRLADSFRTGTGITYEQQGPKAAAGLARMTAPWSRIALVPTILPALDGVVARLAEGGSVVDVGCGSGVTIATIAEAFPAARCVGYDPSSIAIDQARQLVEAKGLGNVELVGAGGEDLPEEPTFDLVLTFDCLHDMPHPDRTIAAIGRAIRPDGTWLAKDIRSTGTFERDARNPMLALMYSFSVASCLQSAMSAEGGMGLGTLGLHPARLEELARAAGFTRFTTHDFDDVANLYYEIRP